MKPWGSLEFPWWEGFMNYISVIGDYLCSSSCVNFGNLCFSRNFTILFKLPKVIILKLLIIVSYLFNICKICSDESTSIPEIDNLSFISFFLICQARVSLIFINLFQKHKLFVSLSFFSVCLLPSSLIFALYYFLPSIYFSFNLLSFF